MALVKSVPHCAVRMGSGSVRRRALDQRGRPRCTGGTVSNCVRLTRTVTRCPMLADCTSRILSALAELRGMMSTSYRRTSAGGSRWFAASEACTSGTVNGL